MAGSIKSSPIAVALGALPSFSTPTFVNPLILGVTAGSNHTCALLVTGEVDCWGKNDFGQVGDGTTTNRNVPTTVASFTFNIDPKVALAASQRVATVGALVLCDPGQQVQVRVSLTQDGVFGQGLTVGACTGLLEEYEVTVPAHGRFGFTEGAAVGEADAIVRKRGMVVETEEWTRNVTLTITP